ncbi:hypothetical protein OF83DRAFT_1159436 [Amylostereum chailletii]|nr:hypothetical protein OF83DRAFT_1159436 [Amylostereum chailletii]
MSNPYALHAAKWGGEIRAARASEARTRLSNLSVDTTNLYVHPTKSAASASTSESLVSFRTPHPPSSITTDHSPFSTYAKFSPDEKSDVDDYDDGSDGHGSGGYDSDHNYESYEYDSDSDYEYGFSSEEHHANCTWAAEHRLWVEQQRANADNRDARPPVENQHDEPSVRTLDGESDEDADNHGGPCAFCSRAAGYTEEGSGFSIDPPRTLLVTDDEDASGYISPFRYAPVGHHRRSPIANERTSPDPFIATPSPRPDVHSSRQDPRPITPLPHPIFRREGSPAPCSVPARVAVDPIHTRPMPKESRALARASRSLQARALRKRDSGAMMMGDPEEMTATPSRRKMSCSVSTASRTKETTRTRMERQVKRRMANIIDHPFHENLVI